MASWCVEYAQHLYHNWLKDLTVTEWTYFSILREAAISAAAPASRAALSIYDSTSGHVTVTAEHNDFPLCPRTSMMTSGFSHSSRITWPALWLWELQSYERLTLQELDASLTYLGLIGRQSVELRASTVALVRDAKVKPQPQTNCNSHLGVCIMSIITSIIMFIVDNSKLSSWFSFSIYSFKK